MTDKGFSPSLSQPHSALTGFEPMLGMLAVRRQPTLLRRLRGIINRLGRWQQPALLQLLDDPNPKLRGRAVRNLRVIGDSRAVPRLLRLLEEEKIDTIRLHVIWALSRIGDQQAGPAILKIAQETEDPRFQIMTLWAIGEMRLVSALPLLLDCTQHPDPAIRRSVITALGMLGNKYAIDSVLRALHDPHPAVRWSAVMWAGEFRDPRAAEGLKISLNDPLPHKLFGKTLSDTAAEALKKIGTPEALAMLQERR